MGENQEKEKGIRGWVIPWLQKEYDEKSYPHHFLTLARKDLNSYEEIDNNRIILLKVSKGLIDQLNYKFDSKEQLKKESEDFTIQFGTVLAQLRQSKFEILIQLKKNIFYTYQPNIEAYGYGKIFYDIEVDNNQSLKVVIFTHKISDMSWPAGRGVIIHELIHILARLDGTKEDEKLVNMIAREWGFGLEIDEANKYTGE